MVQVADIVVKLLDRTDQRKIPWRPTVSEDTFAATIGNWSVFISRPRHIATPEINLRVHDRVGQLLEDFYIGADIVPTYGQLQELHGKAKRKALGTDQQLEELLAELERV